jgi:hypothetical protein
MVPSDKMYYTQGNYSYNTLLLRNFVIPRDYFKIREITLSYDLPKKLLAKTPLNKVTVSLIGRNLFLFTPAKNNYVDPEASNLGNDLLSEFGESTGVSSTRNIGGSIKIEF